MTHVIPLHKAAAAGDIAEVKRLLALGFVDVNAKDNDGDTSLHRASYNGHMEVVKLLLAAGADVNAINRIGETPLYWASLGGYAEVVKILKAAGGK